jgi:tetratricopeptide (TPR) repeat protein
MNKMTAAHRLKSILFLSIAFAGWHPPLLALAAENAISKERESNSTDKERLRRIEIDSETIRPADPEESPGGRFFAWRQSYEAAQTAAIVQDYQLADKLYEHSLKLAERISPTDERVATSRYKLGAIRRQNGDFQSAKELLCTAMDFKKYRLWSQHPTILAAQSELAALYSSKSDSSKADELFQHQLKSAQESGTSPLVVATILNNRAALFLAQGNFLKAKPIIDQILSIQQNSLPAQDPNVAAVFQKAAALYDHNGLYQESAQFYKRALAIYARTGRKYNSSRLLCQSNLIEVLLRQAEWPEALSTAKELAKIGPDIGMEPTSSARILAKVYLITGKATGNRDQLGKAISFYKELTNQSPNAPTFSEPNFVIDLQLLGEAYLYTGQLAEADRYIKKSIAIKQAFPDQSEPIADSWMLLASAYCRQKKFAEAETYYKKALSVVLTAPGNHTAKIAEVCDSWGYEYNWQGKFDLALPLARKALTLAETHYRPNQQILLQYLGHTAVDLAALKQFAEAEPLFARAIKLAEERGDYDRCPTRYWGPYYLETLSALQRNDEIESARARLARIQSTAKERSQK